MTENNPIPPPIRKAATIILVREKNSTLEVYLLKRSTKSAFMGGLYVFPGGVAESEDFGTESWISHIDLSRDQIEQQLGGDTISADEVLGFSIAAIRETLEEAGVVIASANGGSGPDYDQFASYRLKKDLPKDWFRTKIKEENWTLSLSELGRWSHWITPKLMKKRFDTRFFIVFMPKGQTCVPDNLETEQGIWLSPQTALEQNLESKIPLSPPTLVTLTQLLKFKNLNTLKQDIRSRSWGTPIMPRLVPSSGGPVILEPWDPDRNSDIKIDTSDFSNKVLPAGSWFSRIWCDKGIWKPVDI
ncbi:NUDIX hydrolase [Desulfonema magnum]|uniref:NUDIX hydrolase domain-containing protein n=1 Tax=Desulfonema magnum TaxID=45655 RepID=A0A975BP37_9BACT|nr:NUDIX domain-containing protein [Desulfonema magnum]QTA89015.1 NUDIX hydrolase domain-containing protein [Desulfonema magnum]